MNTSPIKYGSEYSSDRYGVRSDGSMKHSKYLSTFRLSDGKMSPVVVIPDLKSVMQSKVVQVRIPFAKVNPFTMRESVPEETGRRRNASRACKKPESGIPVRSAKTETACFNQTNIVKGPPWVKIISEPQRQMPNRFGTDRQNRPYYPKSPIACENSTLCKYCAKSFVFEEFAKEHELYCQNCPDQSALHKVWGEENHVSEESEIKANFLQYFELKENVQQTLCSDSTHLPDIFPQNPTSLDECSAFDHVRLTHGEPLDSKSMRSKKNELISFFRNNPISLTSELGQKVILKSIVGICENPAEMTKKYDQFCATPKNILQMKENRQTWPSTKSRKRKFKSGQFSHYFTFNKTQRLVRNSELVLGLNHRACRLFNKCCDLTVKVEKLPKEQVDKYLRKIEAQRQNAMKSRSTIPVSQLVFNKFLQVKLERLENITGS